VRADIRDREIGGLAGCLKPAGSDDLLIRSRISSISKRSPSQPSAMSARNRRSPLCPW
jgi:hypothetical protein